MISKREAEYHFIFHYGGSEEVVWCKCNEGDIDDAKREKGDYVGIMSFGGEEMMRMPMKEGNTRRYGAREFLEMIEKETGGKREIKAKRIGEAEDEKVYSERYDKITEAIKSGRILKGVIHNESHYECEEWRREILSAFGNAMREGAYGFLYMMVYNRKEEAWIGATPELLLKGKREGKGGYLCETMALAGTKLATDETEWDAKNKEEQRIVCEHIEKVIRECEGEDVEASELRERKAGMVKHLCKEYRFRTKKTIERLCSSLHPTPAVCGYPKEEARKTIEEAEGKERGMYAGYIILRRGEESRAFVNIRCMEFDGKRGFTVHTGCGLTAESEKEAEREELRNKEKAIKKIFGVRYSQQ